MHERVPLHKFQQVRLDMRADDAIRLDDGGGLGIDIIPGPAHLRVQPTF